MLLEYFPEIFWSNHEHWRSTTRFYSPGPVGAIEPVIKGSVEVIPGRLDRVFKTQRGNPDWPEELEPNRSPNIGPNDPPGQKGWRPEARPAGREERPVTRPAGREIVIRGEKRRARSGGASPDRARVYLGDN
jgi:hypothetical protein